MLALGDRDEDAKLFECHGTLAGEIGGLDERGRPGRRPDIFREARFVFALRRSAHSISEQHVKTTDQINQHCWYPEESFEASLDGLGQAVASLK